MNKTEFITAMEQRLIRLPKCDRDDILSDYEAHFARGQEAGQTEEEVCSQLGNPDELAATYLENLPANAKGAPYIPQYTAADTQQNIPQDNAPQYSAPTYGANAAPGVYGSMNNQNVPTKEDKTTGIIIVVLLSIFVAVPLLFSLIGIVFSIIGGAIGCGCVAVALLVGGVVSAGLSLVAGVGVVLLGLALIMLTALIIIGVIAAIKGLVWLVKWYIGICKKLIGGRI